MDTTKNKSKSFSLSTSQQSIWLHQNLNPDSNAYNIPVYFNIDKTISEDSILQAIRGVVNKYDILQTQFRIEDGEPIQSVYYTDGEIPVDFFLLTENNISSEIKEYVRKPFEIANAPLFRFAIIRGYRNERNILMVFHHLISDGTSLYLLAKKIRELANEIEQGLSESKRIKQYIGYEDYIKSEQQIDFSIHKTYWLNKLGGEPPYTSLLHDYNNDKNDRKSSSRHIVIDEINYKNIAFLAKETNSSIYNVLFAGFIILISRLTGEKDIVIGSPVINRDSQTKESQGLFLNTVMLRNRVDPNDSVINLIKQTQSTLFQALRHRSYPFINIVNDLGVKAETGKFPLSSVFFNGLTFFEDELREEGFNAFASNFGLDLNFDLDCYVTYSNKDIVLRFDYRNSLFSKSTIEFALHKYKRILEQMFEKRTESICTIDLADLSRFLPKHKSDAWWYKLESTPVEIFYQQVVRFPENIAIKTCSESITYQQLNDLTNKWANYILKHVNSSKIGICVGHSQNLAIAVLSILKAGKCYIPIDRNYPKERIRLILEETETSTILVENNTIQVFSDLKTCNIINIDNIDLVCYSSTKNISISLNPNAEAYILFTSGSTGKPKGIIQQNKNILHFISQYTINLNITNEDILSGFSPITYDSFVNDFYGAILNGATYCPFSLKDHDDIDEWPILNEITIWHSVPTLFREYSQQWINEGKYFDNFRIVKMTGELVRSEDFENFKKLTPTDARFSVSLGSTEATLTCINLFGHNDSYHRYNMPVGFPVARTSILILDDLGNECGVLEPGEIVVISDFITPGYYNNLELNLKAFQQKESERLYYTGDIGRRLIDGRVEWLYRKDDQVKINGIRIELGEIESCLIKHSQIEDAVVCAKDYSKVEKILYAYYTGEKPLEEKELARHLSQYLPLESIPHHFIKVDKFPYNTNGKLDKNALPDVKYDFKQEYVSPTNSIQNELVKIYSEILNLAIDRISIRSNFFQLGGHSLSAIRLIYKIHKEFGKKIQLSDFYSNSSVEELSVILEQGFNSRFKKIDRLPEQERYQLSYAQQRLWILTQLEDASVAYQISNATKISGRLNINTLQKTFQRLIDRHEVLRTVFIEEKGTPYQKILQVDDIDFNINYRDLRNFNNKEEKAKKFLHSESITLFDFKKAPLMRVSIVQLEEFEFILLLTVHHIICDGWSLEIIINELKHIYNSYINNLSDPLSPLNIQYKDYSSWHNNLLSDEQIGEHRKYWLNRFKGEIPIVDLPISNKRPKFQTFNGSAFSIELEESLTNDIRKYISFYNTTLFVCLLSIIKTLLFRYTSQNDIIVGTAVAGRDHSDLEQQIGFYVNTLAIRTRIEEDDTFEELSQKIQKVCIEAFEHSLYTFDRLVDDLKIVRDPSRNPIFDILVVLQNVRERKGYIEGLEGLNLSHYPLKHVSSKFDLTFNIVELSNTIRIDIEYNTSIFSEDKIRKLVNHLISIAHIVVNEPQVNIASFNYLSELEKTEILHTFNDTEAYYPNDQTIISLFEQQVKLAPKSTAVICGDKKLTYEELNTKSNQLANYLIGKGAKRNTTIAIMAERSLEMIVGIYGILKSGAAYIPIDPSYPLERKRYLLDNSRSNILLIQEKFYETISGSFHKIKIEEEHIYKENNKTIATTNKPQDLAYVIYTSGSTGYPKGVMIEHGSLVNRLHWMQRQYPINCNDIILQKTPYTFDVSVWELFWWAIAGSKVCMLEPEGEKDPLIIIDTISTYNISIIHFVPSMFNMFLEEVYADRKMLEKLSSIKQVFTSGEALLPGQVEKFNHTLKKINHSRLTNLYGPTEATVDVSYYDCPESDKINLVPIGKPIDNIQIYILSSKNQLQPIGIPGELYISGVGLARGYWENESLTQERFVANPFKTGERIYRTGDLARWVDDGNIEYLGRIDYQVKIRGNRIELGEVESVLIKHSAVKEALVVAYNENDENYLCAYYIAKKEVSIDHIRAFISEKLPSYMIPSYFVRIEEFALTSNGKIDRKALPTPRSEIKVNHINPITKEEKVLAKIWSKVLGVDNIGTTDNFFLVGGDSIKAIQISARLRSLGYEITVKDIFSNQTVKDLAAKIREVSYSSDQSLVVGEVSLSPIQYRFFGGSIKQKYHYNHSLMLEYDGYIYENEVISIFKKLQEHHDALRLVFKKEDTHIIAENKDNSLPISLEVADLTYEALPEEQIRKTSNKIQSSIDLENGPLMRLGLFHLKEESYLLIVIHHLVVDGVSWRILLEDIQTLFNQTKSNNTLSLPMKSDSFKLWVEKLNEYTKSSKFKKARLYWDAISNQEFEEIQRDYPDGDSALKYRKVKTFSLCKEKTADLQKKVHKPFNTQINDILITALSLAINEVYKISSIVVDIEGHGREEILPDINISRTVGWFTSIYPLLLRKEGESIADMIRYVKESSRKIPNNGIDYLLLKYNSIDGISANAKQKKQPQICFNYLGQFNSDFETTFYSFDSDLKGDNISFEEKSEYDWNISGAIIADELKMYIMYNGLQYNEHTAESFALCYQNNLIKIVNYCNEYGTIELTPSDLSYKDLSFDFLNTLQSKYQIKDIYALSPMQEGMLFYSLYEEQSTHYFEQLTYELKGDIDIISIENALNALIDRYDILRTVFIHENVKRPLQVVLEKRITAVTYKNIQDEIGEDSKQKVILKYLNDDKRKKFILEEDTLIRITVLQTSSSEYTLMWSYHHILMDGWCLALVIREFHLLYNSYLKGKKLTLPLTRPYSSYINWLEERDKETSLSYWKNYLDGYSTPVTLPQKENLRLKELSYQFQNDYFSLKKERILLLQKVSGRYGVTINTILQTAWAILLSRYNNVDDVVFGSVVSGRPSEIEAIETMVGLFINTIPVRIKIAESGTIAELLIKTQREALESEPYHYNALSDIQSLSGPGRELLDHIMIFENYPITDRLELYRNEGNIMDYQILNVKLSEQTNYNLAIIVNPGEEIEICFNYNSNVFSRDIILQISKHFSNIIEYISINNEADVSTLDFLTKEERIQLVNGYNNTKLYYPKDKTIHQLFEEQASKQPNAIAVAYQNEKIDYKTLNSRANQVARYLIDKGVERGNVVGLMLNRSLEIMIGLYGILKTGCAYLPIDPDYPKDRIKYMIDDSGIRMLITQNDLIERISVQEMVFIDINDEKINTYDSSNLKIHHPRDLAYVIYTSGSTGRPKGSMVEHQSVVNLITGVNAVMPYVTGESILSLMSISFDVFVLETFVMLSIGIVVTLATKQELTDPVMIASVIKKSQSTILALTPSRLVMIMQSSESNNILKSLQILMVGGEAFSPDLLRELKTKFTGRIFNMYGPTEATVTSTIKEVTHESLVSLGQPIANTQLYILSQNKMLQPLEVPGELCIGGDGLSRGYWQNEKLTKEKFITNPFKEGEKIYCTGDLVKRNMDGEIEFLGRLDQQVKIRGYRIELGEIEEALTKHEDIAEAAVILYSKDDEKYLCAYIVLKHELSIKDIRLYLTCMLPEYMIPTYITKLQKLPLNANGKIDRKALPVPSLDLKSDLTLPQTETEHTLVKIWADVLGYPPHQIGIDTNFFEIGGHSLKIITIINRIREELLINIPYNELFKNPTIRILANDIDRKKQTTSIEHENLLLLKESKENSKHFFFIHAGNGEAVIYSELCEELSDNYTYWGIKSDRVHEFAPQKMSIESIAKKYVEAILRVDMHGPYYIAGWCIGGIIAFEVVRQLEERGKEIAFLGIIDSTSPDKSFKGKNQNFEIATELSLIEQFIGSDCKEFNCLSIKNLWDATALYLKDKNYTKEKLLKKIPQEMIAAMYLHENQNAEMIFRQINILRSYGMAKVKYMPQNKLHTNLFYFSAKEGENIEGFSWNAYTKHPIQYLELDGNHFSIMKKPGILNLVTLFQKALDSIKNNI